MKIIAVIAIAIAIATLLLMNSPVRATERCLPVYFEPGIVYADIGENIKLRLLEIDPESCWVKLENLLSANPYAAWYPAAQLTGLMRTEP